MLKPETEKVWQFCQKQPLLEGFILLGGSALALHLHHRFSEDLDFAYPAERLPRLRLEALRRAAAEVGLELEAHDDPLAVAEFSNGGLDLLDYQQDLLANRKVKLSFFAPDRGSRAILLPTSAMPGPRVATLDELFRSKSLLSARRSRSRDRFDLYVLMTRCGYTMKDYHDAFAIARQENQLATGLQRLCSQSVPPNDEAFEPVEFTVPSPEDLALFFRNQRDAFERSAAARAWRERHP